MLYAVSWLFVALLLALWSLITWAVHAVAVWAVSQAGALSGMASGSVSLSLPAWLAPWVPPGLTAALTDWASSLGPLLDSLLQTIPALAGGLTVLAWVVWAIGAMLLMLTGAGLHALIAWWRRKSPAPALGLARANP